MLRKSKIYMFYIADVCHALFIYQLAQNIKNCLVDSKKLIKIITSYNIDYIMFSVWINLITPF